MDPRETLHVDDLKAIALRHKEEREHCGLSYADVAYKVPYLLSADGVKALEMKGKLPRPEYFAYLAVRTEMDALYILCGRHLPIRLNEDEKLFWATYLQLDEADKADLRAQAQKLYEISNEASEELAFYRKYGEVYKGVGIRSLIEDEAAIKQMKRYLDETESDGLIHYVRTLEYDPRSALYSLCFVRGFEVESEPGEQLMLMAKLYVIEPLDISK